MFNFKTSIPRSLLSNSTQFPISMKVERTRDLNVILPSEGDTNSRAPEHEESSELGTWELVMVVFFACVGTGLPYIQKNYMSGFFIDYLEEKGLSITFGGFNY